MNGDNVGARLWGLIVKPGQVMAWVKERPLWWVAGIVLFVGMAAVSALTVHIADPEQMEVMRDTRLGQLTPAEQWQEEYENALAPSPVRRLVSGLTGGLGVWIMTFIYAALFLFFGKMAGGQATFKQVLGVTYWAMLAPYFFGSLLRLPLIFAKQSVMGVSLGLAALAPGAEITSAKYMALMTFGDFTVWWGLILIILGFGKINGFSWGKAATVVLLPWFLITGALFGLGRLVMG
jgi:hypothetical protein